MNTILQKRIEEAAFDVVPPGTRHTLIRRKAFIKGATFALQNQWISVEEALPEYEKCVLVHFEGEDEVCEMFSQRNKPSDNLIIDKNGFQVVGFTEVTHWMPIPKLKGGEE